MKITKTASGKQIVKLSKSDWENFGKKAGWLDDNGKLKVQAEEELLREAQPAVAPPKRKTDVPTETPDQKPGERRRRKPRPLVNPKPKGEEKEEEVSPDNMPTIASELKKLKKKLASKPSFENLDIKPYFTSISKNASYFEKFSQNYPANYERFWGNIPQNNPLSYNAFIMNNGGNLSRGNYDYLIAQARQKNLPIANNVGSAMQGIMQSLGAIKRLEAGHEEELVELAKDVISEEWGIDRDELDASFMNAPGGSGTPPKFDEENVPLTPALKDEIGKRSVMNGLSQGAGLHSLLGIHHHPAARGRLNEISADLLGLYDKFGNLISQSYFLMSPDQMEAMENQLAEQGSGWAETDEEGNVKGQGMTFSIICQELVKGLVAQYTNHQFDPQSRQERGLEPLTEEEARTVLNEADRLNFEPLQIQFGTELWRKFLEASTGEGVDKIDLMTHFSTSESGALDEIMTEVATNPERALERLTEIQAEIADTDFGYETDETDEAGEELGMPDEEGGDAPDDLNDLNNELAGLFDDFGPPPNANNQFGEVDQGLPPVEFDDDDDDEKPFWMP